MALASAFILAERPSTEIDGAVVKLSINEWGKYTVVVMTVDGSTHFHGWVWEFIENAIRHFNEGEL